jgi:hypothetical protein
MSSAEVLDLWCQLQATAHPTRKAETADLKGIYDLCIMMSAGRQARLEAEARNERTL